MPTTFPRKKTANVQKGAECDFTDARQFNLMFKTFVGPIEDEAAVAFLRPETAQGMFVNFLNVQQSGRLKPPFGIAQIGKSFRNEITPGNFIFRTREFEQMEMEFFVKPGTDDEWFEYWREQRMNWYTQRLGIKHRTFASTTIPKKTSRITQKRQLISNIVTRSVGENSKALPIARTSISSNMESIAAKISPSLMKRHANATNRMSLNRRLELIASFLITLLDAYREDEQEGEPRIVLRFHPRLAPIKVGIFPLLRKEGQPEKALHIRDMLKERFAVFYDQAGSIGRRYRRQDEVGTPFGITVDHQTMQDNTVTLRDRDTLEQVRIPMDRLMAELVSRIEA